MLDRTTLLEQVNDEMTTECSSKRKSVHVERGSSAVFMDETETMVGAMMEDCVDAFLLNTVLPLLALVFILVFMFELDPDSRLKHATCIVGSAIATTWLACQKLAAR